MELECVKYGEKMAAAQATCKHPGDYCQHRQSCMIQFMERENRGQQKMADKEADSRNVLLQSQK